MADVPNLHRRPRRAFDRPGVGPVAAPPPTEVVHSFLFTDIVASTELWDRHPEEMAEALAHHDAVVEDAVLAHGGRRVKHTGDGLMAVFSDPGDAVRAAIRAQRSLTEASDGQGFMISTRIGVHLGPASERRGDYFGTTPNRCARITGIAHGGQILVSAEVAAALEPGLRGEGIEVFALGLRSLRGLSHPEVIHQVWSHGLIRDFPDSGAVRLLTDLPRPATALIGRQQLLEDTVRALDASVLVTLIGPGGVGKTRLATQVAHAIADAGDRSVGYVDLLPAHGSILGHTVATSLGATRIGDEHAVDAIARVLGEDDAVIVLDNVEHVVAALSELTEQLSARCPSVTLLVTSQTPVGLPGERIVAVNPLGTEPGGAAYQLFVDRAVENDPGFAVDGHEMEIIELCAALDGLPLAVELAAARVRSMSPVDILDRLGHRLQFLRLPAGHPRARRGGGLGDVIAWSHDLLDDDERTLFARLGTFRGGFSLRAAELVAAGEPLEEWQVADLLDRLVQRSLVTVERHAGVTEYRLLESIAAFAEERLAELGDEHQLAHERHSEHYLAKLVALDVGDRDRVDDFELAADNVRAAIDWRVHADPERAVELLLDRYRALVAVGAQDDAQTWFELASSQPQVRDHPRRAELLQRIGQLATATASRLADGRRALEEALALYERDGRAEGVVAARLHLATMLTLYPASLDLDAAAVHLEALEALVPEGTQPFLEARIHGSAAMRHLYRRESDRAVERAHRAALAAASAGVPVLEVNARCFEGANRAYAGDLHGGLALLEQGWADAVAAGFTFMAATAAWLRGYAAVLLADPQDAVRWFSREIDSGRADPHPAVRRSLRANLAIALLQLGDVAAARELARGTLAVNGTLLEPMLAYIRSGFDEGDEATDRLLVHLRQIGDLNEAAAVCLWAGRFDLIAGRPERAATLLHEALAIATRAPACPYYEVPVRAELALLGEPGHLDRIAAIAATTPIRGLEARVHLARAVVGPEGESEERFSDALAVAARFRLAIDRIEILVRRANHRVERGDLAGGRSDRTAVRRILGASPVAGEWSHLTSRWE